MSECVIPSLDHALDLGLIGANKIRLLLRQRMEIKSDETNGPF